MATPGDLIRIFAEALYLPEVRVGAYYRNLREEGLVTKGGTGRSAPKSTAADAGSLLTALLGADGGVDAGDAVLRYSAIFGLVEFEDEVGRGAGQYKFDMSAYLDVSFSMAVQLLFRSFDQVVTKLNAHSPGQRARVEVSAHPTNTTAAIRIGSTVVHYEDQHLSGSPARPGLIVTRSVGEEALAIIANGLRAPKSDRGKR